MVGDGRVGVKHHGAIVDRYAVGLWPMFDVNSPDFCVFPPIFENFNTIFIRESERNDSQYY